MAAIEEPGGGRGANGGGGQRRQIALTAAVSLAASIVGMLITGAAFARAIATKDDVTAAVEAMAKSDQVVSRAEVSRAIESEGPYVEDRRALWDAIGRMENRLGKVEENTGAMRESIARIEAAVTR